VAGAAALSAPTIVASSALENDSKIAASERITLGHIGVGGRGSSLLRGFRSLPDVECVAVCDAFRSRRESWAKRVGCKAYADFREILARADIDAVVVATPDHWHVPIATAAARAGKDMYVEKPLGISVRHDQAARAAIRLHERVFQYGTQQRSMDHCRFGCELVRNGRLGRVHTIHVLAPDGNTGGSRKSIPVPDDLDYEMWLGPAPNVPYTKDRTSRAGAWFVYDYALGFIAGWGAHPLDIAQWGFDTHLQGEVEVEGKGMIPSEGLFDTVVHWDLTYRFASGVTMTLKPGRDATRFVGTKGWVEISRSGIRADPKSLLDEKISPEELHLPKSSRHDRNFVDCVKSRKTPVSSIDDAVRSDVLSHLGDIAIRTKRKIRWNPEKEIIIGDESASRRLTRPLRAPWTV